MLARFFWVVRLYTRNGFTVVIVDHTEDGTVSSNYSGWLAVRTILTSQTPESPSNDSRYMMNWLIYFIELEEPNLSEAQRAQHVAHSFVSRSLPRPLDAVVGRQEYVLPLSCSTLLETSGETAIRRFPPLEWNREYIPKLYVTHISSPDHIYVPLLESALVHLLHQSWITNCTLVVKMH